MRRLHLLEIEDQAWCPRAVRDGGTDWLHFMASTHKAFDAIGPKLRQVMTRFGSDRVVDLCSGGGGPWLSLAPLLRRTGELDLRLTDFYPNRAAFERVSRESLGGIGYSSHSVDATDVPRELIGVRTMFNAFHHFRPPQAQAILADAVRKRCPIVIVEGSDHRGLGVAMIFLMLLAMPVLTPRVPPFRWSRLLLTYVIPAIPLLGLIDGIVSMLRIYSPSELRELVARIPSHASFDWDIGTLPVRGSPIGLTYLVGVPASATP